MSALGGLGRTGTAATAGVAADAATVGTLRRVPGDFGGSLRCGVGPG